MAWPSGQCSGLRVEMLLVPIPAPAAASALLSFVSRSQRLVLWMSWKSEVTCVTGVCTLNNPRQRKLEVQPWQNSVEIPRTLRMISGWVAPLCHGWLSLREIHIRATNTNDGDHRNNPTDDPNLF